MKICRVYLSSGQEFELWNQLVITQSTAPLFLICKRRWPWPSCLRTKGLAYVTAPGTCVPFTTPAAVTAVQLIITVLIVLEFC